ncbi:MAG: sugar phosphate isomerase/epimerase [Anaerolineae bacterium]|nr:sugar phosphate isomerase/epimerase [Anaerolineae bacterium]
MPHLTLSTGSLYLYSLERCFALAVEAGFDGVEVLVDERYDTRQPDHLCRLMDAHDLPIMSLHAPFPGRKLAGWQPGIVASVTQTVTLAEALGAAHVVMHTPDRIRTIKLPVTIDGQRLKLPWFAPASQVIQDWISSGGLRRLQNSTPVKICVENLPTPFDVLRRYLPQINQQPLAYWNTLDAWPCVHDYLTLDTTHWATHRVSPLEAYRAGGERVRHIHLSNFLAGREHQLPHIGELDLAGFLRVLSAEDFDGQIVVEVKPGSLDAHDESKVRRHLADTVAFCRAALAR